MELSEILRNDLVHFTQTLKVDEELCSYMLQGRVLSVGNVDDITVSTFLRSYVIFIYVIFT